MSSIEVPKPAMIGVAVLLAALLIGGIWWRTGIHRAEGQDNSRIIAQETTEQLQHPPQDSGSVRGKPEPGAPQ